VNSGLTIRSSSLPATHNNEGEEKWLKVVAVAGNPPRFGAIGPPDGPEGTTTLAVLSTSLAGDGMPAGGPAQTFIPC
jgi:hypothetical protein